MNTPQVLRFPKLGLVVVALILLVASLIAVLIPLAWSLISAARSPAPIQADSLKVVDAFHSAVNNADAEAVLALFAPDATINDHGAIIQGREEIRNWIQHSQQMVGLRLTMLHSETHPNKVIWNDLAHNGPEVEHSFYLLRWTAAMQNGKIQALAVTLQPMPDGK